MEVLEQLKIALDKITAARARIVNAMKSAWWARPAFLAQVIGPTIALTVTTATFWKTQRLDFFSLHPFCMSLAFAVFMPQGVVAFRNHLLLDALGPIMQHGTKHKNRSIHMMLQVLACFFALLGLLFILSSKIARGSSISPRTIHGALGILVMLFLALQAVVGRLKYVSVTTGDIDARKRGRRLRWHGKMGMLVYDLSTLTFVLGLFAFFRVSGAALWATLLSAYAWLNVNLQMHEAKHVPVSVYHSDGGEVQPSEDAPETQQLTDEGASESKGDRKNYPL